MEFPATIAGVETLKIRDMIKDFVEGETGVVWKDGVPVHVPRKITLDLIVAALGVSGADAKRIKKTLVSEGWIYPRRLVPTRRGMALAQYIDRPRISRAEAEKILSQVLDWADRTGAEGGADARVRLKSIDLFGSLERGEADVGDIDLFVEFTPSPSSGELEPDDLDRQNEMADEIKVISEYISLSDELERMSMSDVPCRRVFPRP